MTTKTDDRRAHMIVGQVHDMPWLARRGAHDAEALGREGRDGTDALRILRVHVLGRPEVRLGGRPLAFRTRRALALLIYLAVEGGLHARETLAALLSPHHDPDRARTMLRRCCGTVWRCCGRPCDHGACRGGPCLGLYFFPFAAGNLLGPLLIGHLFDTIGRRKMILFTYGVSGLVLAISGLLFDQGALSATTQTIFWCVIFFLASAGASSAYLTVSEIFPLEVRAQAPSVFFAISQLAGAWSHRRCSRPCSAAAPAGVR